MNELTSGADFVPQICLDDFSQAAFSALLTTMNAEQVAALLEPSFAQPWKHREAIYRRLSRLHDENAVGAVVRGLIAILEDDALRDARYRGSADGGLRKLVPLLQRDEAITRALGFLTHRRRSRRETGRRALLALAASEAAQTMLELGLAAHDDDLVRAALRLGAGFDNLDMMLRIVGDGADASRLIERQADQLSVSDYASQFPNAVFRFIGRARRFDLGWLAVEMLERLMAEPFRHEFFRDYNTDDLIGLGFWTLGQLDLRDDIIRLESADTIRRAAHITTGPVNGDVHT